MDLVKLPPNKLPVDDPDPPWPNAVAKLTGFTEEGVLFIS